MSATMVELRLTQDCYLICYDANSTKNEDIRKRIVELTCMENISDASEFMLSRSCYLIPKIVAEDLASKRLNYVTLDSDYLHILSLEKHSTFITKKQWVDDANNKHVSSLYDVISPTDKSKD